MHMLGDLPTDGGISLFGVIFAAARDFLQAALIPTLIGGDAHLRSNLHARIHALHVPLPPRPRERCDVAPAHSNPESCLSDNSRNHLTRCRRAKLTQLFRSARSTGRDLSGDVRDQGLNPAVSVPQRLDGCVGSAAALGDCGMGATRRVDRATRAVPERARGGGTWRPPYVELADAAPASKVARCVLSGCESVPAGPAIAALAARNGCTASGFAAAAPAGPPKSCPGDVRRCPRASWAMQGAYSLSVTSHVRPEIARFEPPRGHHARDRCISAS